jgi:hypothetical protein
VAAVVVVLVAAVEVAAVVSLMELCHHKPQAQLSR